MKRCVTKVESICALQQLLVGDGELGNECMEREPKQWQHEQQHQGDFEQCPLRELVRSAFF